MNEGISFYTILITAVFILVVALISVLVWIFDRDELPAEKVNDENDFNHRTG
jgi:heme/copper-type cytochrome/quinol oxidase subunit 2